MSRFNVVHEWVSGGWAVGEWWGRDGPIFWGLLETDRPP